MTVEIQYDENQADTIDGDEFRLQQVLMKLLSNAIKFSLQGRQVTIICRLEAEALGITKVGIKVVDEGVGISIEDQAKLFKLFGFVEQIQDDLNTQGLGMGLYIAKLISEQFDGGVSVESELGHGSTFGFTMAFEQIVRLREVAARLMNPNQPKRENKIYLRRPGQLVNDLSVEISLDSEVNFSLQRQELESMQNLVHRPMN